MRFSRLGLINKGQGGMTLLEVMLVIAITSVISGGITMTFFQTFDGTVRASNRITAINQVQHVGYLVSHDAHLAQDVEVGEEEDMGFPFVLSWTGWDNAEHAVTYSLEDMLAGGLQQLRQSHVVNAGDPTETIVARFIDPAGTSVDFVDTNEDTVDDTLIFTVTVTIGGGSHEQSETRVYSVAPRPGS